MGMVRCFDRAALSPQLLRCMRFPVLSQSWYAAGAEKTDLHEEC
jgi:hypothetical protein